MKVSIIVPVYNVEKYLEQCIESIINQSYKNLEIILVDDGSTDNSGKICDKYMTFDSRVSVIHKTNEGPMHSRKIGFARSTGEYIGFVDSDDWIDGNMYSQLVKYAISEEADIVSCQLVKEHINLSNKKTIEELKLQPGVYNYERIKHKIIPGIINDGSYLGRKLSPNKVTKLFKREIIEKNLIFLDDEITLGEDLITCFSCVCDAKKIVVMDGFYPYHYRTNSESITVKYDKNRIKKVEQLNYKLQQIAISKGLNIDEQIANDYISLALLCIEEEILSSPYEKGKIINNIINISESDLFKKSMLNGNTRNFSIKYKCILFLISRKKYGLIYLLRKTITFVKSIKIRIKQKEKILMEDN